MESSRIDKTRIRSNYMRISVIRKIAVRFIAPGELFRIALSAFSSFRHFSAVQHFSKVLVSNLKHRSATYILGVQFFKPLLQKRRRVVALRSLMHKSLAFGSGHKCFSKNDGYRCYATDGRFSVSRRPTSSGL